MTYWEATVYGTLQGLTEFLPVSSSAHLALAPWLLGWKDPGLAFDVALHMGTLAAILAYFHSDWLSLGRAALRDPRGRRARLLWLLAAATLPAAAAGLAFDEYAETFLRRPSAIAAALIVFGLLMGLADRFGAKTAGLAEVRARQALVVGLAQALAIIPGVSRSGVTMTAALALGLERDAAARFSFLLATPIILGAGVLKLRHIQAAEMTGPFLWAVAVSAVTGFAAVHFFLDRLRSSGLRPYVIYRVAFGGLVLVVAACR